MPVVVEGIPELKRALKNFAPELRKEMDDEIRAALKEVVTVAKARFHLKRLAIFTIGMKQNASPQAA